MRYGKLKTDIEMKNEMVSSKLPNLSKEQKKEISKVTDRYIRMRKNRMKRKLISWMKIHKN
jgi:aspartyl-tRNA synthetase